MSIEPLAGAHVRANASHSAIIGSRFATMKSDSRNRPPNRGTSPGWSSISAATRVEGRRSPVTLLFRRHPKLAEPFERLDRAEVLQLVELADLDLPFGVVTVRGR